MQEHHEEIESLGAEALGISVAADFQAEDLMANHVGFPLLLDPDRNFKQAALQVDKLNLLTYLTLESQRRYLKWRKKTRQGRPTAGLSEPPAVAIIDPDGVVQYLYKGQTLGDYPPIEEVLARLAEITA